MTISINSDGFRKKPDAVLIPSRSSGSEGCVDDKKRRRMESNRESARRSRQKKQQHLDGLIRQLGTLKRQNEEFEKKIAEYSALFSSMESQNGVLNAEKDRLAAKLEGLENVIEIARFNDGNGKGDGDLMMMNPWKLPCCSTPITSAAASSGLWGFKFNA